MQVSGTSLRANQLGQWALGDESGSRMRELPKFKDRESQLESAMGLAGALPVQVRAGKTRG